MNLLVLLALIPFAFAETAPNCEQLAPILQTYEKNLQRQVIKNGGSEDQPKCLEFNFEITGLSNVSTEILNEYKCQNLNEIETHLETLKNQLEIATGIVRLKTDLNKAQEEVKNDPNNGKTAKQSFVTNLNIAQSLELLLEGVTNDDSSLMAELKKVSKDKRSNPTDFKASLKVICKNRKDQQVVDACGDLFNPNSEAIKEINGLLEQGDTSKDQIEKWKKMLAIKRKGKEGDEAYYSFVTMHSEMEAAFAKLDSGKDLDRQEMLVLQRLDQFENANGLSFVEEIALAKTKLKAKYPVDNFRFLVEDAKRRQEYEIMSKLSIAWDEIDKKNIQMPQEDFTSCDQARVNFESALNCKFALENKVKKQLAGTAQSDLNQFLKGLNSAANHQAHLKKLGTECLEQVKTSGALSNSCLNGITDEQAKIQEKILAFNLIKEQIGFENKEQMVFRNFALAKWNSLGCGAAQSNIEFCDPNEMSKERISTTASLLSSQIMNISIMYSPVAEAEAKNAEELKALCDAKENKKDMDKKICAYLDGASGSTIYNTADIHAQRKREEEYTHTTAAPDNGREKEKRRDAWIQGAANIFNTALTAYYTNPNQVPSGVSPYPYNYSPYAGRGSMGIADSILFNARYHGAYGYYMPAAGYKAGTAFPTTGTSSLGSYSTLKTSYPNSYFGK